MARRTLARFALPLASRRRDGTRTALSLALIMCLGGSGRPLTAQEKAQSAPLDAQQWSSVTPSAFAWPRLVEVQCRSLAAEELLGIAQPAQRGSSRDTLENGAIIGAIVGAVGLGALGGVHLSSVPRGGRRELFAGHTARRRDRGAIGAGAGVAVDAALTRNTGGTVRTGVTF